MIRTIYVDFDGTIVNSIASIVGLYNEDFKYYKNFKNINQTDINTFDFTECNCASTEYINIYFNQQRFFDRLEFMDNAEEVLNRLKDKYKIVVISMGHFPNIAAKKAWVKEHMPYADFIGVSFESYDDKSHIDMSDGIYIDDNMKNLNTNAIENICFGDLYEWNKCWDGKRCFNWTDLEKHIGGDK